MLRRADLRYGAFIPAAAVERDVEESESAAAAMKARHRRFRESRRRRQIRDQVLKERDDDEKSQGDESPSSDDESSTVNSQPPPATSRLSIGSTSTAVLASTTTSLIATTTTSVPPPPPPPARTTLSSIATSTLSTSLSSSSPSPFSSSIPIQTSSASAKISAVPLVKSSISTVPTSTSQSFTTSYPKITSTTTIITPISSTTATATGLADNQNVTKSSQMSGLETALIVIGVFFALIVIGLTTWAFIKRTTLIQRFRDRRTSYEQNEKGPVFAANRRDSADDESRIWGAASTVGAKTATEAAFPAYVPPLFQQGGGIPAPVGPNISMNGLEAHPGVMVMPPSPPPVVEKPMGRLPSVRDSVATTTTLSSLPRFRDIRSWARDQRRRRGPDDNIPDMPTGSYQRFD